MCHQEGLDFTDLVLKWGQAVGSRAGTAVKEQEARGVT